MSSIQKEWLGPGEMARRLGVSAKALRVYEREGLIAPLRSEGGWRVYGPVEAERLHKVLTLRTLGLSLKRIKVLIAEDQASFETVLLLQEEALESQQQRTEAALVLLRAARCRIAAGKRLSLDDLINLMRETVMTNPTPNESFKAKAEALLSDRGLLSEGHTLFADMRRQVEASGKTREELLDDAKTLLAEAELLMQLKDTGSERAKAFARRWTALLPNLKPPSTPRAPEVRAALREVIDGDSASPFNPVVISIVSSLVREMKERGEL